MVITELKTHAFDPNDALGDLDAVALAERLRRGEVSVREVVEASIARAHKVNPVLNAIVSECFERALQEADTMRPGAEGSGFFAGLPTFIKDMTHVVGLPTAYGTPALAGGKPAKKADPIVRQIQALGFLPLGKSSMPEFGFTCSTEFPGDQPDTCNPWDSRRTAGGSSGGAAALVAAGVVPLAHSADGGGSTRIPAACCGLVGLKPTRGRLLQSDIFRKQAIDIGIDGIITRSVRDTAHFYAHAEAHYHYKKLPKIGLVEGPSDKRYRIVFTGDSVGGYGADPDTRRILNETAERLRGLGHEVEEVRLPVSDQFIDDFINAWSMAAFLCHRFGKMGFGRHFQPKLLSNLTRGLSRHYGRNFFRTPFFMRRMRRTQYDYIRLFERFQCDLILTPTMSRSAPELGYLSMDLEFEEFLPRMMQWACFSPYSNASGAPSISLPVGHCATNDLPVGMLFWGKHGQEATLFDLAYQLEADRPWRRING